MFRCLLTVVCCLLSFYLHALEVKDFTFSHLGKTEGLDNQRIFSIRQTETGAIWWSSMTGVGRYNGLRVKNYPLDKGTPYGQCDAKELIILFFALGVGSRFISRQIIFDN